MKKTISIAYLICDYTNKSLLLSKSQNKYDFFKRELPLDGLSATDFSVVCEIIKSETNISVHVSRIIKIPPHPSEKEKLLILFEAISPVTQKNGSKFRWVNFHDEIEAEKDVKTTISYIQQNALEWHLPQNLSKKVLEANNRAISFLESKVIQQGELVGLPHYLGEGSIGSIGTATGILCHAYTNRFTPLLNSYIDTLKKVQNEDGGWSILSADKTNISITESTLFALLALRYAGISKQDDTITKGVKWLEKSQRESGGWSTSIYSSHEGVFQTAFAIRALSKIDIESRLVKNGVMWLKKSVNLDGGWAAYNTPTQNKSRALYTAHSLIALLSVGENIESGYIQNGRKQILQECMPSAEYGWDDLSYVEPASGDMIDKVHYNHFSLPWILISLVKTGTPIYDPKIMIYFDKIIQNQHALGYWEHKLAPNKAPVWAIHDSLLMLNMLGDYSLSHFENFASISSLRQENITLRDSIVIALSSTSKNDSDIYQWIALGSGFLLAGFILWEFLKAKFSPVTSVIGTTVITGLVSLLYAVILEEYKKWRFRFADKEKNE